MQKHGFNIGQPQIREKTYFAIQTRTINITRHKGLKRQYQNFGVQIF